MSIYKQLRVTFDYSPEFDKHNHELVGYVIQRYPRKVVATAIVTRESVPTWYEETRKRYPENKYTLLLGTISIVGIVESMVDSDESSEKDKAFYQPSAAKRDPSAN